jgi:hypothetical protein
MTSRLAPRKWCKDSEAHAGHHFAHPKTGLIWWCKGTWR